VIQESDLKRLDEWAASDEVVLNPTLTVQITRAWVPLLITEVRALQAMVTFNDFFKEATDEGATSELRDAVPASKEVGDGGSVTGDGDKPERDHPVPVPAENGTRRRRRARRPKAPAEGRSDAGGDSPEGGGDQGSVDAGGGSPQVGG
jgi:hypothetical protein